MNVVAVAVEMLWRCQEKSRQDERLKYSKPGLRARGAIGCFVLWLLYYIYLLFLSFTGLVFFVVFSIARSL